MKISSDDFFVGLLLLFKFMSSDIDRQSALAVNFRGEILSSALGQNHLGDDFTAFSFLNFREEDVVVYLSYAPKTNDLIGIDEKSSIKRVVFYEPDFNETIFSEKIVFNKFDGNLNWIRDFASQKF